ncbi:hypothetical protein LFL96_22520 [Paraburkholderia sp. D15]|uniref:hypothetical protein n=1 Tax=Paraburkholderia sp. D15 TaxID=2880218 RepID=UPI002479EDE3|nr:hypothetical protein [Paraburkholderia sp. D15]WGS53821.1 hypothetical protein LFL96_22520 [Paraburkholderia sp. D15]WKF60649.1 hypothetical protein HUO10_005170 [Paraburkholderia busanensis]
MNGSNQPDPSTTRLSPRKRFYMAGAAILIVSLIAAAMLYAVAPPPDSAVSQYSIADPRYQIELQRIGGNAEVLMAQLHDWFDGLWQGTALAGTVAVLGVAMAGACFFIGHYFIDDEPRR